METYSLPVFLYSIPWVNRFKEKYVNGFLPRQTVCSFKITSLQIKKTTIVNIDNHTSDNKYCKMQSNAETIYQVFPNILVRVRSFIYH